MGAGRAGSWRGASVDGVQATDATMLGRAARWMLLFCTLFGLATMHTLGHAGMDSHTGVVSMASTQVDLLPGGTGSGMLRFEAVVTPCPDGHCGGGHGTGGMDAWSVCLAVLGGLATVILLSVLLLRHRSGSVRPHDRAAGGPPVSRAPPGRRNLGLHVASLTVMRI